MLTTHTLALGMPGSWEWIVILVIGILIFGKRLPEVGKSIGKGIVEFKKGLAGIDEEIKDVRDEVKKPVNIESQKDTSTTVDTNKVQANADPSTQS